MDDNYLHIDGVRLFYASRNSQCSPTIFFFHGNSSSHATWLRQLDSDVFTGFRLIAFDLPAHGLSDAASVATADYSLPGLGALLEKAVTLLAGDRPFLLAGVSLGTNIIAEMLAASLRPAGLLLAGPCIAGADLTPAKFMKPDTCIGLSFVDDLNENDLQCLLTLIAENAQLVAGQITADIKAVKDGFRGKLGQSLTEGRLSDQVALVKALACPVLVVFGAADPAIDPDYLDGAGLPLWRDCVIKLPGAGHWVHLDEPKIFNRLLREFSETVFTTADS